MASTAPTDQYSEVVIVHVCAFVPVHSPWLPGDTDVGQTILVILTMAGLFPDRPHTQNSFSPIYLNEYFNIYCLITFASLLRNWLADFTVCLSVWEGQAQVTFPGPGLWTPYLGLPTRPRVAPEPASLKC